MTHRQISPTSEELVLLGKLVGIRGLDLLRGLQACGDHAKLYEIRLSSFAARYPRGVEALAHPEEPLAVARALYGLRAACDGVGATLLVDRIHALELRLLERPASADLLWHHQAQGINAAVVALAAALTVRLKRPD
jgi:hypothetical protein